MRWTLRKCDALLGTIMAALSGIAFAQLPAFIQQYLQRLGGHIAEARSNLTQVADAAAYRALDAPARDALTASLEQRTADLANAEAAISAASTSLRPFVFVREVDPEIALATLRIFEPALPLSSAGFIYGLAGIVMGWAIYEVCKAPLAAARRRRNRRNRARIEPTLTWR